MIHAAARGRNSRSERVRFSRIFGAGSFSSAIDRDWGIRLGNRASTAPEPIASSTDTTMNHRKYLADMSAHVRGRRADERKETTGYAASAAPGGPRVIFRSQPLHCNFMSRS